MQNKVLIFGFGQQGKKYRQCFSKNNYKIDIITRSGKIGSIDEGISQVFSFNDRLLEKEFLEQYDIIIIAVFPYNSQKYIIQKIAEISLKNIKILIEKPVSYDLQILQYVENNKNIYFFIDEILLNTFYNKIITYNNVILVLYDKEKEFYSNILEHIFGGFLLLENFQNFLERVQLKFISKISFRNELYYNIIFGKNIIQFKKGEIFLNKKKIYSLNFESSVSYILSLSEEENILYKKNFYQMRKFINAL